MLKKVIFKRITILLSILFIFFGAVFSAPLQVNACNVGVGIGGEIIGEVLIEPLATVIVALASGIGIEYVKSSDSNELQTCQKSIAYFCMTHGYDIDEWCQQAASYVRYSADGKIYFQGDFLNEYLDWVTLPSEQKLVTQNGVGENRTEFNYVYMHLNDTLYGSHDYTTLTDGIFFAINDYGYLMFPSDTVNTDVLNLTMYGSYQYVYHFDGTNLVTEGRGEIPVTFSTDGMYYCIFLDYFDNAFFYEIDGLIPSHLTDIETMSAILGSIPNENERNRADTFALGNAQPFTDEQTEDKTAVISPNISVSDGATAGDYIKGLGHTISEGTYAGSTTIENSNDIDQDATAPLFGTPSGAGIYEYDLTDVFPFCIPFDIYDFISLFDGEPQAPTFEIVAGSDEIGIKAVTSVNLDDYFHNYIGIFRTFVYILFLAGFIVFANKIIKH